MVDSVELLFVSSDSVGSKRKTLLNRFLECGVEKKEVGFYSNSVFFLSHTIFLCFSVSRCPRSGTTLLCLEEGDRI